MRLKNNSQRISLASIFICFFIPQVQAGFWDDAVNKAKTTAKEIVDETVDKVTSDTPSDTTDTAPEDTSSKTNANTSTRTAPAIANVQSKVKHSRPVDATDIIGLSIGMTPQEVISVLKNRGLIITGQRINEAHNSWLSGHEFTTYIVANSQKRRGNTERVTVSFSAPPAKNLVQAIFRGQKFKKGNEKLSDSISKALINKYGQPSYQNKNSNLIWAFDKKSMHYFSSKEVTGCTDITQINEHSMEGSLGRMSNQSCNHSIISARVGNSTDFTNRIYTSLVDYPTIFTNQRRTKKYNETLIEAKAKKRREEAEKQEIDIGL